MGRIETWNGKQRERKWEWHERRKKKRQIFPNNFRNIESKKIKAFRGIDGVCTAKVYASILVYTFVFFFFRFSPNGDPCTFAPHRIKVFSLSLASCITFLHYYMYLLYHPLWYSFLKKSEIDAKMMNTKCQSKRICGKVRKNRSFREVCKWEEKKVFHSIREVVNGKAYHIDTPHTSSDAETEHNSQTESLSCTKQLIKSKLCALLY